MKHCRCGAPLRYRNTICGPCVNVHVRFQARAIAAVRRAVQRGKLQPARSFSCADCSKPATEYDHRDYTRPLDVSPVCHGCNIRRGRAFWPIPQPAAQEAGRAS